MSRTIPTPYAVPAALLHDAVEKTSMQWADLRSAGADERLVAVLDALTERSGEAERDYLARCATEPLALRIKRADLADTLATLRTLGVPAADRARLQARAKHRLELLERLANDDNLE